MKFPFAEYCECYKELLLQFANAVQTGATSATADVSTSFTADAVICRRAAGCLEYWQNLDSTQYRVKEAATAAAENINLIIARRQEKGRGRYGRHFFSPLGGLYFSFILPPGKLPLALYTPLLATALAESLASVCQRDCRIKWVNDLYWRRKKVAGIITEFVVSEQPQIVCGIGVNWCAPLNASLPPAIAGRVGNLALPLANANLQTAYLSDLQRELLIEFFTKLQQYEEQRISAAGDFMELYEARLLGKGEQVLLSDGREVLLQGVDHNDGSLLVYQGKKQLKINSGEVSLRLDGNEGVNW